MDNRDGSIIDVFERYGLSRIINASGTETTKGASPVCPEVLEAVVALVPHCVDMLELQSVACHTIARAFECEGGLVAHCSSAGIATAVAACMTGANLARAERLPDTRGMKSEIIIQRGHNVTYGGYITQNVELTGARIVEIGAATECGVYQLAEAITPETAAVLYVVSHHTVQSGLISLEEVCETAHAHRIPVIVDGAAEPEPRLFLRAGADLVITSMHKSFAGLTGATVAGRLDLIQACLYQEKGIGRPMKASKECVISAIAAIERWSRADHPAISRTRMERLEHGKAELEALPGIKVEIELDSTSRLFSRLLLHVDPTAAGITAYQLSAGLSVLRPSIAVRTLMADIGLLQVDLRRADDATANYIIDSIKSVVVKGPATGDQAQPPSVNLADKAVASLEKFPLPTKAS
jgi:L-seryl-tRNA(Ser) seleniumtransferase